MLFGRIVVLGESLVFYLLLVLLLIALSMIQILHIAGYRTNGKGHRSRTLETYNVLPSRTQPLQDYITAYSQPIVVKFRGNSNLASIA